MQGIKTQVGLYSTTLLLLLGCASKKEDPGKEYAPQMYHSVPYEPLSQIKDKEAGRWLTSRAEGEAEFYNSNPFNPHEMTMRAPVQGTVRQIRSGEAHYLPYRLPKDSLSLAARTIRNPLDSTESVIRSGKVLYERFCKHCHGETGEGDGLVGKVFKGVPSYTSRAVQNVPEGHIFHVITHGKGRMKAHSSQIGYTDRWKIVRYVQTLQKK